MSLRTILMIAGLIAAGVMMNRCVQDPQRTALPFGTTDLSSVQEQLARLSPEDRALVEAYVTRSNGDVLTADLADPDDPLTARTFGEAITLQKNWIVRSGVADAEQSERVAQREARIAPLRALVRASVVKAEIITRNEFQARQSPDFYKQPYQVDNNPTFYVRIRVQNLGNERIVAIKGALKAHDSQAVFPMDLCWIDLGADQAIDARSSVDVNCGGRMQASAQEEAFVRSPDGRFRVQWEPRYLKLENGRELDSGV